MWCWLGPLAGSSGHWRFKVKKTVLQLCKSRNEGPQLAPNTSDISFCLVVPSHLQMLTPDFFVNAVHTVHFHKYSSTPLGLLGLSGTWCSHYRLLDCPLELSWQGTVKYHREKPSFGPASLSIKGAEKWNELPTELKAEQNHPPFKITLKKCLKHDQSCSHV